MVTTAPQNALTTFMADSLEEFVIVLTVMFAIHQRAAVFKAEYGNQSQRHSGKRKKKTARRKY